MSATFNFPHVNSSKNDYFVNSKKPKKMNNFIIKKIIQTFLRNSKYEIQN